MIVTFEYLDVPFHLQDYDDTCGAACEMMVLHSLGVQLEYCTQYILMAKNSIYDDPAYEETGWGADPSGMPKTLNDFYLSDLAGNYIKFTYHALPDEISVTRKIISIINKLHVACVALVLGYKHWVVVTGYVVESPGLMFDPAGPYTILGLVINDPLPSRNSDTPHCDHEDICTEKMPVDRCGDGIVVSSEPQPHYVDYGTAYRFITYNTWRCDYMTGVPTLAKIPEVFEDHGETAAAEATQEPVEEPLPPWDLKFVAVCAYEVMALPPFEAATVSTPYLVPATSVEPSRSAASPSYADGMTQVSVVIDDDPPFILPCALLQPSDGVLLALEDAKTAAGKGLTQNGLGALGPVWQKVIAAADPGTPSLISRLDRTGSKYYLVPMNDGPTRVPVVARIDAYSGAFLEAVAVSPAGSVALPSIPETEQQLLGSHMQVDLADGQGPVELNAGNYDGLFWQPCLEAFSPFYPFFKFHPNGREVFVPLDVFIRLTSIGQPIPHFYTQLTTNAAGK